jgi:hypothetical protein
MATPFHKPVVCPVLIDRVDELTAIYTLIEQANSGRGQVVLLAGEAGIGKSRLVAEAKAYAAIVTLSTFVPLSVNSAKGLSDTKGFLPPATGKLLSS